MSSNERQELAIRFFVRRTAGQLAMREWEAKRDGLNLQEMYDEQYREEYEQARQLGLAETYASAYREIAEI